MSRIACLLAITALGVTSLPAVASPEEARELLQRMTEALATRNYDGLFTHSTTRQSDVMRIVHRIENGHSVERLVSLDGSGREIVRTSEQVHCYLPDRRVVLVEPRSDRGSLLSALPAPIALADAVYGMGVSGGHKLLGQPVRIVEVLPRDNYRYGYRIWIAEETAMPLRSAVVDGRGRLIEQVLFTRLDLPESIPASETEPSVDTTGFHWVHGGRPGTLRLSMPAGWRVARLPPGFRLVGTREQQVPGLPMPVSHLLFSDGLASVSVFIEPGHPRGPAPPAGLRAGSANAYSASVRGRAVTAVGEVPPATLRDIATSLVQDGDAASSARIGR